MKTIKRREPKTRVEWQEAVDAAEVVLLIDNARQYGLITGDPSVDIDRCVEILRRGKRRGILPSPDAVERLLLKTEAKP